MKSQKQHIVERSVNEMESLDCFYRPRRRHSRELHTGGTITSKIAECLVQCLIVDAECTTIIKLIQTKCAVCNWLNLIPHFDNDA